MVGAPHSCAAGSRSTRPDYPVGVRLSADEQTPGGLSADQTASIARSFEPLIDYLDLSFSGYYNFDKMFATMDTPLGYELPTSEIVARAVDVPTIVTGRIMSLDDARRVIVNGTADMVSLVRPLVADPELIAKARSGRAHEVRPCIGTNQGCVGKFFTTGRMRCTVNPSAGREVEMPFGEVPQADSPGRVVVVGGGPAGLEAARAAALRGHTVDLFEMRRELGGQVAIAATAPHRADIGAITAWLADEVRRLGVRVHLGAVVDPDEIRARSPHAVIVAAGSTPRRDGFQSLTPATLVPGSQLPHVYTSWEVFGFGGNAKVGKRALLYDDTGTYEAISVAEELQSRGAQVVFATRFETIGAKEFGPAVIHPARARLVKAGMELMPTTTILEITASDVELSTMAGAVINRVPADTVVVVGYNRPNREYADELVDAPFPVHVVGDATGSQTIQDAITQAAQIARAI